MVNSFEINKIGKYQKAKILKDVKRFRFEKALAKVSRYAQMYYWAPMQYSDEVIEAAMSELAVEKRRSSASIKMSQETQASVLLVDSFGYHSRGLVPQYLDALAKIFATVQYLYTGSAPCDPNLITFIRANERIEFAWVPCSNKKSEFDRLNNYVRSRAFSAAFFHIAPWSVIEVILAARLDKITYLIDITDHSFWLGAKIFDHYIGFREYGRLVAMEKRGIPKERYSILQFYPVDEIKNHRGLPAEVTAKTKIMTGGAEYKLFGGDGKLLRLLGQIVAEHPDCAVCILGDLPEPKIRKAMGVSSDESRVVFLGFRDDVKSVIAEADIFVPTYPWGGGLLTEYAIINCVPVVALEDPLLPFGSMRGLLLRPDESNVSFDNEADFMSQLRRLCVSVECRNEAGRALRNQLPTPDCFTKNLKKIIVQDGVICGVGQPQLSIDYDAVENLYLDLECGKFGGRLTVSIFRMGGVAALIRHPVYTYRALLLALRLVIKNFLRK